MSGNIKHALDKLAEIYTRDTGPMWPDDLRAAYQRAVAELEGAAAAGDPVRDRNGEVVTDRNGEPIRDRPAMPDAGLDLAEALVFDAYPVAGGKAKKRLRVRRGDVTAVMEGPMPGRSEIAFAGSGGRIQVDGDVEAVQKLVFG